MEYKDADNKNIAHDFENLLINIDNNYIPRFGSFYTKSK